MLTNIYNFKGAKLSMAACEDNEQLTALKSHLTLIKAMTGDKAEEEFYELMEKAKLVLGEISLDMGYFYYEYAKFLIEKLEKNIDIFNAHQLPTNDLEQGVNQQVIAEKQDEEDDSDLQPQSENNINYNNVYQNEGGENLKEKEGGDVKEKTQEKTQQIQDGVIIHSPSPLKKGNQKQEEAPAQKSQKNQAEQDDDFDVCSSNLLCALNIFQSQRNRIEEGGEPQRMQLQEILKFISRCRSRLGDLYHLNQNYEEAVEEYRKVIKEQQKKQGHQFNRGLAEIHYMIGNSFLYDNKVGCQKIAIRQFIQAVTILANRLKHLNDDLTVYQLPTEQKVKVDRFAYLPVPTDSDEMRDIKEVISCLLDKIEDTYEQIEIRQQYEEEKKKTKTADIQSEFKQVAEGTTVIKLGTFGNRKKQPQVNLEMDEKQKDKTE